MARIFSLIKFKTIKSRFSFSVIFVVTILFVLSAIVVIATDTAEEKDDLSEKLITTEKLATLAITEPLWSFDISGMETTARALYSDKEIGYIHIKDNYGRTLYENQRGGEPYSENNLTYIEKALFKDDKYIGQIIIGLTNHFRKSHFISLIYKSLMLFAVFVLVMWVTISFISDIVTRPILEVINGTESIAKGNLSTDIEVSAVDEIGSLAKSVNKMKNDVKSYIEELFIRVDELNEKNSEIAEQKDEINALYEQAASMNGELNYYIEKLKSSYLMTVLSLAKAIEAKDKYTKGHCERVTKYCIAIAKAMGMDNEALNSLEFAGLLHDIGKIGVPSNVLTKPERLSDDEFAAIKEHPSTGYEIIKDNDFLSDCANIILQHHERLDGKGYPMGLKSNEINVLSKILSVADSYDAMTSSRPYRNVPLTSEEAIMQLEANKNTQFDEEIVNVFVSLIRNNIIE